MKNQYLKYDCSDLVLDEDFIAWVRDPNPETDAFWHDLETSDPRLAKEIENARLILQSFNFKEPELSESDRQLLWKNILTSSDRKLHLIIRYAVATAACIAILFGIRFWNKSVNEKSYRLTDIAALTQPDMMSDKIQMVLADSTNYIIDDEIAEIQYDKTGQLKVNSNNINQIKDISKTNEVKFNQLIVPWGKRTSISFADGSKIWLNAGSRAIYPTEFIGNKREIYIEGEAYFDVAKDKSKPFIVQTKDIEVSVLGTCFNVNAYTADDMVTVALVTGSVQVKQENHRKTVLRPNQIMCANKTSATQEVKTVDIYDYICWREGILKFNNENLETVLKKLERYYAITIKIETSPDHYTISGKLDLKDDINSVLQVISKMVPIQFKEINNQIIILKKESPMV